MPLMFTRIVENGRRYRLRVVGAFRNGAGEPELRVVASPGRIGGVRDRQPGARVRGFGEVFVPNALGKGLGTGRSGPTRLRPRSVWPLLPVGRQGGRHRSQTRRWQTGAADECLRPALRWRSHPVSVIGRNRRLCRANQLTGGVPPFFRRTCVVARTSGMPARRNRSGCRGRMPSVRGACDEHGPEARRPGGGNPAP